MRGSSLRRVVSRVCFGAAAVALVAALFPAGAGAQSTTTGGSSDSSKGPAKPKVYSTVTSATAVDYVPDQQGGLTPIKDATHMQFVTGKSTISSSNGPTAKATVVDPGNGATQGPANACPILSGFFPSAALQPIFDACTNAKWPFIAQADGFSPDKSTDGSLSFGSPSTQVNGEGGAANAHIDKEQGTSSTDSTMSGLKIAPLPGGTAGGLPLPADLAKSISDANGGSLDTSLFSVGSIQSTTQNFFDGPAEVSHAESRLNGVRFIGGLMTIDSITSISDVHFTVDGDAVGTSSTTVQGAKVLGKPVTIDDKGVHPDGNSGADTGALQNAGLTVKLVGATNGPDPKGFMTAASEGVVVEYSHDVQTGVQLPPPPPGNPLLPSSPTVNGTYFVHYNLATVSSRAFARNLTAGGSSFKSSSGSLSSSITPPKASSATSGFSGGKSSAPAASLAQTAADNGGGGDTSHAAFINVDFNLKWLYLAFTLVALGMCLAPRFAFTSRLPGRSKA
ncbi:MAG TPA: choice-of-anchor P family protein [Acidimicrobiales bacterium]|nr:choice-of-anchor P family protein [Acidimicrobiales bacterium]